MKNLLKKSKEVATPEPTDMDIANKCTEEIQALLAKYNCVIEPEITINRIGVCNATVRIVRVIEPTEPTEQPNE